MLKISNYSLNYSARIRQREIDIFGFLSLCRQLGDVLLGVAGAALWMAPYLVFDSFASLVPAVDKGLNVPLIEAPVRLGLRAIGFCLVTPFMEELFVRSWLQR